MQKEISYEESLRLVLENTRYSHLYQMLLDAYQMRYLDKGSKKSKENQKSLVPNHTDTQKGQVPIPDRCVPFVYVNDYFGTYSIFIDPLSPDHNQTDPTSHHPQIDESAYTSKKQRASIARKEGARKAREKEEAARVQKMEGEKLAAEEAARGQKLAEEKLAAEEAARAHKLEEEKLAAQEDRRI
jgi:hypothetical protein